jgi:hypothetical protein
MAPRVQIPAPVRPVIDADVIQSARRTRAYRVVFDRIGRTHNPPPLVVEAAGPDHLADLIYRYARPFLGSEDVEVHVAPNPGKGLIHCGIRTGGRFTVELVDGGQAATPAVSR